MISLPETLERVPEHIALERADKGQKTNKGGLPPAGVVPNNMVNAVEAAKILGSSQSFSYRLADLYGIEVFTIVTKTGNKVRFYKIEDIEAIRDGKIEHRPRKNREEKLNHRRLRCKNCGGFFSSAKNCCSRCGSTEGEPT